MRADDETRAAIGKLVTETYRRLSTPGADAGALFSHADMAAAGSGIGELADGPEESRGMGDYVASRGLGWTVETIATWQEGDVAWAQILGSVRRRGDSGDEDVPYTTTGVFGRDANGWHWRYWGGAEPQAEPKV
jgi:hypothetical protein